MKPISAVLAAALVAGSCTVALAQASGGSGAAGAAGGDQSQQGTLKDADKNPSGAANPAAGNTGAAPMAGQPGQGSVSGQGGAMTTAPASNVRSDSPQRPAGAKDAPGATTGGGGSK